MSWGYAALIAMVFYRDQIGGIISDHPQLLVLLAVLLVVMSLAESGFNIYSMWKRSKY